MHSTRVWTFFLVVAASTLVVSGDRGDVDNIDYVVEVLAVVDKPSLDRWVSSSGAGSEEAVREEVNSMFFEVNAIYQSLRVFNLSIEFRLKDVVFPNESVVPLDHVDEEGRVGKIYSGVALTAWLQRNGYEPGTDYDHAMYLLSYKLPGIKGIAETNGVCSKRGKSRVRANRKYSSAVTAAHELGHSLGAGHDKGACAKGYVMSVGRQENSRRRWQFSPCTAATLRRTLSKRGKDNCMTRTTTEPIVSPRMGQILTAADMCMRLNEGTPVKTSGDEVCNVVSCRKGSFKASTSTPEGMSCGDGKRCFMGYCVEA